MLRQWTVLNIAGNLFQKGLPDKYCIHNKYKQRWVELKNKNRYQFTKAQLEIFPLIDRTKIGIWVITEASEDEYAKLFEPPNWKKYLHPRDIKKIKEKYSFFQL